MITIVKSGGEFKLKKEGKTDLIAEEIFSTDDRLSPNTEQDFKNGLQKGTIRFLKKNQKININRTNYKVPKGKPGNTKVCYYGVTRTLSSYSIAGCYYDQIPFEWQ